LRFDHEKGHSNNIMIIILYSPYWWPWTNGV